MFGLFFEKCFSTTIITFSECLIRSATNLSSFRRTNVLACWHGPTICRCEVVVHRVILRWRGNICPGRTRSINVQKRSSHTLLLTLCQPFRAHVLFRTHWLHGDLRPSPSTSSRNGKCPYFWGRASRSFRPCKSCSRTRIRRARFYPAPPSTTGVRSRLCWGS